MLVNFVVTISVNSYNVISLLDSIRDFCSRGSYLLWIFVDGTLFK